VGEARAALARLDPRYLDELDGTKTPP